MSIEAAGDGGSMMGMPRDVAQKLAAWTLLVRSICNSHFFNQLDIDFVLML